MKISPSLSFAKTLLLAVGAVCCLQGAVTAATLTNRYSFTADATDSVGGKNGGISNAVIVAGQVLLDSPAGTQSSDPTGQYVDLPDNIVTGYTAVTIEMWFTPNHNDAPGAEWNRIWDFGNSAAPPFMWMRSGNNLQGIRADVVPVGNADVVNGPIIPNSVESHLVFTCNGDTLRGRLYVNGTVVGINDTFDSTPAALGSTTNNWLGRSQFAADSYVRGSINEFRIYDGDLNPLEVAASYQSGPDAVFSGVGTVTNIVLQVASPLAVNAGTKAVVLAATDTLTNKAIDIANSSIPVTFVSGNTNILTVTTNGDITAKLAGTTTVIASYAGISSTQSVTVVAIPTSLKNRYSFDSDVTDSVGGKNGALQGGATIIDGEVVLDANSFSYVDLPGGLIDPTNIQNSAVTFEAWATFYPQNGAWTRLFDFGGQNSGSGLGYRYVFFAPNTAPDYGFAQVAVSDADPGFNGENNFRATRVLGLTNAHIVVVYNPNPSRQILAYYLDGELQFSTATTKPLTSISNVFSWLGRSLYSGDSFLNGSINEFRIYDGELSRFQIAASHQAGPNAVHFNVGSVVSFTLDTGGSVGLGQTKRLKALMNFTSPANVDVAGRDTTLTLTSSDTNVVTVTSPGGVMRGISVGSATITGIYAYTTNGVTTMYTNTALVSVTSTAVTNFLVHRYSFTADANDSVGTAHATLEGGASISGGKAVLDGSSGYIDFPDGMVSSLGSNGATFEMWLTDNSSGNFSRLLDFGTKNTAGDAGIPPNLFLARRLNDFNIPRFDWSDGFIDANTALQSNVVTHVVLVYDDVADADFLYMNGVLVGSTANGSRIPLSSLMDVNNWIGRSQYNADSYLNAAIDEFRVYNGLLTAAQVQANFAAGPDAIPQPPVQGPQITASISGGNLILSWTTNDTSGFTLETKGSLGAATWSPVGGAPSIVGANYQQSVPLSDTNGFFRLKQ